MWGQGDERAAWLLRWEAPGAHGNIGQAASYDLRISTTAPGSDINAWWASAASQIGVSAPLSFGSLETYSVSSLVPGQTVYAAIRTSNSLNEWSAISPVISWTPNNVPFLEELSPNQLSSGTHVFTLTGIGLEDVNLVSFHPKVGTSFSSTQIQNIGGDQLAVTVTVPSDVSGGTEVEVHTAGSSDVLKGWLELVAEDEVPPTNVTDLSAALVGDRSVELTWSAPTAIDQGVWGPAVGYELRELGGGPGNWNWETGDIVPTPFLPGVPGSAESLTIDQLSPGATLAFAIRSKDADGNWSPTSNMVEIQIPAGNFPPDPVSNLSAIVVNSTTVELRWSAPGDPVATGMAKVHSYDLRRFQGNGAWSFEQGSAIPAPSPKDPGVLEVLTLSNLTENSVQSFALKSRDWDGLWSASSNVVTVNLAQPTDVTPPSTVSDLAGTVSIDGAVSLSWSVPTDNSPLLNYEFRFESGGQSIDGFLWDQAEIMASPPGPAASGKQVWTIEEPSFSVPFRVAMISRDVWGNESLVSNTAVIEPLEDQIAPFLPAALELSRAGSGRIQMRWRAGGDDGEVGQATAYEIRYVENPNTQTAWWLAAQQYPILVTPKNPGKLEHHNIDGLTGGVVYGFALRSLDEVGRSSDWRIGYLAVDGSGNLQDTSPPLAPAGVNGNFFQGRVILSWNASPEPHVSGYEIRRRVDNLYVQVVGEVGVGVTTFTDRSLPVGDLDYAILAITEEGDRSPGSSWVRVDNITNAPSFSVNPLEASLGLELRGLAGTPDEVRIEVFDVRGALVQTLRADLRGGAWHASWSGRSRSGRALPNGIYFARVKNVQNPLTQKLLLNR